MKAIVSVFTMLMSGALGLSGCDAQIEHPQVKTCEQPCVLPITLPDTEAPNEIEPGAPDLFRIAGNTPLDFEVSGETAARGGVILSFEEPIVRREQGDWMYTIRLNPGRNRYTVRPYEDNLCHAPAGCKYVIIHLAEPGRRSTIQSPGVIIDPK